MFNRLGWLREYISLLSTKAVKRWFVLMVIAFGCFFLLGSPVWYSSLVALFSLSANIGWLMATGFPFVIGASLMFCSKLTQNRIAERARTKGEVSFFLLFVSYAILILFGIVIVSSSGLLLAAFGSGNLAILLFLPQLLGVTLAISLVLLPIYVLLALIVDNARISILIGFVLSFVIIIGTGTPRFPVNYPEFAFFGPAHLLSALLFVSIGAYGNYQADAYVGIMFELIHLILPIVVLSLLSVLSFYGSKRIFFDNLPRWSLEWDDWVLRSQSTQERDTSGRLQNPLVFLQNLDSRRKKVVSVAIAVIILIPFGFIIYSQVREQEWVQIVYESPTGGETVDIGEWLHGSFTGVEPPPSITLGVGCSGQISDWPGGPGYIYFVFEHSPMTLMEFQDLNETEFEDLFGHSESGNYGTTGTFGGGLGGPIHGEEYVWVLKFNDINGQISGSINVWFQVVIRPM